MWTKPGAHLVARRRDFSALPALHRSLCRRIGAALLQLAWRPAPTPRWLWLNGVFLLAMVPFGFHWIPQNAELRCGSGILFGFGLVAFLWLTLPDGFFLSGRREEARTEIANRKSQIANASEPPHVGSYKFFAAGLLAALVLTPMLAENGNAVAAGILIFACVAGALRAGGAAAGQSAFAATLPGPAHFCRWHEGTVFIRPPAAANVAVQRTGDIILATAGLRLNGRDAAATLSRLARGNPRRAAAPNGLALARTRTPRASSCRGRDGRGGRELCGMSAPGAAREKSRRESHRRRLFFWPRRAAGFANRPRGCRRAWRGRKHNCRTGARSPGEFGGRNGHGCGNFSLCVASGAQPKRDRHRACPVAAEFQRNCTGWKPVPLRPSANLCAPSRDRSSKISTTCRCPLGICCQCATTAPAAAIIRD